MGKLRYLVFCNECGAPKHIPLYILKSYIPNKAVKYIYCNNCKNCNPIPEPMRKLTQELTKGDKKVYE